MITNMTETHCAMAIAPDDLLWVDEQEFLRAWRQITGQPPAVMLPRAEMVAILVETWPGRRRPAAQANFSGARRH